MTVPLPPALVLTAGLGTRLAPLTGVRAKPAVPVSGTPLILRVLRWLAAQGVPAAVLNLHHRPETITRCVGHGAASSLAVRYSWEPTILGTAGGPRRALPLLGERFFVVNGDTLTDVDLPALVRAHAAGGAQVTLAVAPNPAPARYGGVLVDDRGRVRGFSRPGRHAGQHFLGVQIAESAAFAGLRDGQPAASIGGVYDALVAGSPGAVGTYAGAATFHDIGTPADYLAASLALARADGLTAPAPGDRCAIDGEARLVRTALWDDVTIGTGCRLTECIVADGVRVPPGSTYERQIITAGGGPAPDGGRRAGDLWLSPLQTSMGR
ncbi:MAG: NTP transferase domain-containing protein [Acidobacteria bacterium]|nr:NTP transferase domain-containing protein [Acidobacteriota bacterium]